MSLKPDERTPEGGSAPGKGAGGKRKSRSPDDGYEGSMEAEIVARAMRMYKGRYEESRKVMDVFFECKKKSDGESYSARSGVWATTEEEERLIGELCLTSRAVYGEANVYGVSPVMKHLLHGYLKSFGYSETRIPQLFDLASQRQEANKISRMAQAKAWVASREE